MDISKIDFHNIDRIKRINLINSITGIKTVNLVGTTDKNKIPNLGIFSSIVHISSKPALIGLFIRCNKQVRRDTLANIISEKVYTINHVHPKYVKQAHLTSIKFEKNVSEFEKCNFTEYYIQNFSAPFVFESHVRIGLHLKEIVDLKFSNSKLIVGKIEHIFINTSFLEKDYTLNIQETNSVSISGLNHYYLNKKFVSLPYARIDHIIDK